MDSRVTYQNINPEVTQKLWRIMSPNAEGRWLDNAPGFRVTDGFIFWYSRPRRHVIHVKRHFEMKTKPINMEHTVLRFFMSFSNYAPLFTMLCNGLVVSRTRGNKYEDQIHGRVIHV